MNFLELVEYYMFELGFSEDLACQLATYELYPERYNAEDYI